MMGRDMRGMLSCLYIRASRRGAQYIYAHLPTANRLRTGKWHDGALKLLWVAHFWVGDVQCSVQTRSGGQRMLWPPRSHESHKSHAHAGPGGVYFTEQTSEPSDSARLPRRACRCRPCADPETASKYRSA